jgi:hypothetical protein
MSEPSMRRGLLTLCLIVGVGACSSGADDADEARDPWIVEADLAECMVDAGHVDLQDVDQRRQADPDFESDLGACADEVGVELPEPGEVTRQWDEYVLALIGCLRDRGWEVPEPARGDGGRLNMGIVSDYVPDERMDAFDADEESCSDELAQMSGRGSGA